MKSNTKKKSRGINERLDWLNPDQRLTEREHPGDDVPTFRESLSRGLRSTLAVILCIVVPALWYFDWNPKTLVDTGREAVAGIFEGEISVAPLPPAPPASGTEANDFTMNLTDYMAELNRMGYLDKITTPAATSFYENRIPISYLMQLDRSGYLEALSFPAIIGFYRNGIPIEYLDRLKQAGYLDMLSFPAVISFYKNKVPESYLTELHEAGFLENFSFPSVVAYYKNGVTIDFLKDLESKELLTDLPFPDVVSLYRSQ